MKDKSNHEQAGRSTQHSQKRNSLASTPSGLRIGLTGGVASGKSTVAKLFAEFDITIIDADLIAREVVLPDSDGLTAVVKKFGPEVLTSNDSLDRKALRNIIFSDPASKQALNDILHPLIRQRMIERSQEARGPYHILDIPLLVESGWHDYVDRVLVVDCTQEIQIMRLQQRDQCSVQQALGIIGSQASRQTRLAQADDIIHNNQRPAALAPQVNKFHQNYLKLALSSD